MPFEFSYTIEDEKDQKSVLTLFWDGGGFIADPFTDAQTAARSMATLLDAVIAGRITGIRISARVSLPNGLKAAAFPDSDVEEGAQLLYRTEGGYTYRQRLPTIRDTLVDGENVLMNEPELSAWRFWMENYIEASPQEDGNFCDQRGDALLTFIRARVQFKRSRE